MRADLLAWPKTVIQSVVSGKFAMQYAQSLAACGLSPGFLFRRLEKLGFLVVWSAVVLEMRSNWAGKLTLKAVYAKLVG